ncbi:MAG: hypothetical protein AAF481_15850 [Acidobacteriota bacterium]
MGRRWRGGGAFLGLAVACLVTLGWTAQPPSTAGDRPAVEPIYEQYGLEREAATPGLSEWISQTIERLVDRLRSRVDLEVGTPSRRLLKGVAWTVIVLALCALLWAAVRWMIRRRSATVGEAEQPLPATESAVGTPDWRSELFRRLDRGDTSGALEALWWWLAERLAQSTAPDTAQEAARSTTLASWTGRELIRRSRRPDLSDSVSVLDRLRYGPIAPQVPQVRSLLEDLEGRLR